MSHSNTNTVLVPPKSPQCVRCLFATHEKQMQEREKNETKLVLKLNTTPEDETPTALAKTVDEFLRMFLL